MALTVSFGDNGLRFAELDARQLGRPFKQRLAGNDDTRRDAAPHVFAFGRDIVKCGCRSEINDNRFFAIFIIRGDGIDDAVRADFFGIIVKNRHARFDSGANDQRFDVKILDAQRLQNIQHRRHDTGMIIAETALISLAFIRMDWYKL